MTIKREIKSSTHDVRVQMKDIFCKFFVPPVYICADGFPLSMLKFNCGVYPILLLKRNSHPYTGKIKLGEVNTIQVSTGMIASKANDCLNHKALYIALSMCIFSSTFQLFFIHIMTTYSFPFFWI